MRFEKIKHWDGDTEYFATVAGYTVSVWPKSSLWKPQRHWLWKGNQCLWVGGSRFGWGE